MFKKSASFLLLLSLAFGTFPDAIAQSRRPSRKAKPPSPSTTSNREGTLSGPGEAVIQIHRDFVEIPLSLSPRGVLVIDYPRTDAVYFLHTSKKFLLIDRESRLEHDPIVVRTGEDLPSADKGDPGSAVLTVQMDSGLFVTFLVTFTKSPKLSTHRVVLSYDPREISEARQKSGLFTGYQRMADGSRQNLPVTTAQRTVETPASGVPSPPDQTSPAPVKPSDLPTSETPSDPPIQPNKTSLDRPPQIGHPPTGSIGGPSVRENEFPPVVPIDPLATTFETPDIQAGEGVRSSSRLKRIFGIQGPPPLPKKDPLQIQSDLQDQYDRNAKVAVIQFGIPQNGLGAAILSRGRLDANTAYVVVAVRNMSKQSLFLLSDQPLISLVTTSPRKKLIDSRVVSKLFTIGTEAPFELKPDERAVWAVAFPSQILSDNQSLQILVYHDTAANRPSISSVR